MYKNWHVSCTQKYKKLNFGPNFRVENRRIRNFQARGQNLTCTNFIPKIRRKLHGHLNFKVILVIVFLRIFDTPCQKKLFWAHYYCYEQVIEPKSFNKDEKPQLTKLTTYLMHMYKQIFGIGQVQAGYLWMIFSYNETYFTSRIHNMKH